MTPIAHFFYQLKCFLLCYISGTFYSFKQLFWKTIKTTHRLSTYNGKDFSKVEKPLALITGGTKGIGFEVAKLLAKEKFTLILIARNVDDGLTALKELKKLNPECSATFHSVDIKNETQLKSFLKNEVLAKYSKLHLLINNAAVMLTPFIPAQNDTEFQWAINFVGLLQITETLLPLVERAANEDGLGRIINLSSSAQFSHQFNVEYFTTPMTSLNYSSHGAYSNSKLAITLYTKFLQSRLSEKVDAFSLHPGVISTQLFKYTSFINRKFFENQIVRRFLRPVEDAAWDIIFLCFESSEKLAGHAYFENNVGTKPAYVDKATFDAFVEYCKKLAREFKV